MTKPLISVIIPVYGADKYLDKAIQSVRNQTLTDIEIICVNDCSPDNSQAILERHAQADPRIKIINHKENLHEGGARNTGIKNASADWLYFMDNDDLLYENCCEELYKPTINNDIDLVVCDSYNTVDTIVGTFHTGGFLSVPVKKLHDKIISLKDINYQIHDLLPTPPWSKLHKKSFMLSHQIFFPENITCSDWSVALLEYGYSNKIYVVNKPLYKYKFIRKGSQTAIYGDFTPFKISFESKIKIILNDPQVDDKIKSAVLISSIRFFYYYFCRSSKQKIIDNIEYVKTILNQYQKILSLENVRYSNVIQAFQKGDLKQIQSFKLYKLSRLLNLCGFLWNWAYIVNYHIKKRKN